jgi:hypothetical protein
MATEVADQATEVANLAREAADQATDRHNPEREADYGLSKKHFYKHSNKLHQCQELSG